MPSLPEQVLCQVRPLEALVLWPLPQVELLLAERKPHYQVKMFWLAQRKAELLEAYPLWALRAFHL
jgi:hypothetical protein